MEMQSKVQAFRALDLDSNPNSAPRPTGKLLHLFKKVATAGLSGRLFCVRFCVLHSLHLLSH